MSRPYRTVGLLVTQRVGRSKVHQVLPLASLEDEPMPVALALVQDLEYRICWDAKARAWLVMVRA